MVATSQPLAAQAGLSVLAQGGNAIDAAIATAAALTVVEPCSNGLGSDAFALVWHDGELHGLNGSGRWPMANSAEQLRNDGRRHVPRWGWAGVTVPGAVDTWAVLHERFGKAPIDVVLAPALRYAEQGYPVSPVVALQWQFAHEHYTKLGLPEVAGWAEVFAPGGRAPTTGERWTAPGHATALRSLINNGLRDFYEGEIADAIVAYAADTGGAMAAADLAAHHAEWVDPISVRYNSNDGPVDVWEIPPNGQGIAALVALGIAQHTSAASLDQLDPAGWHERIEAMKLAFSDTDAYVGDMQHASVPVDGLLDPAYHQARSALIADQASTPERGEPGTGGTVYLCTADRDGNMVSFIQSNYHGFGSGVVVPSHGISLQNRGAGFVLEPGHPNEAKPGKRPRHTIIPGFLTRNGEPLGPFGVMGGEMQPQGHLQVVTGMFDHGLNPQAALDTPRWQVERNHVVMVEPGISATIIDGLQARGHQVEIAPHRLGFGRGQIILRMPNGTYIAGSEPRADGCAVGL